MKMDMKYIERLLNSLLIYVISMLKKLTKLRRKLLTPHVLAAIVTILIANAMGWIDTGEITKQFERFQEHKTAVAGVFIA